MQYNALVFRYECIAINSTIGFDTFTIIFNRAIMSVYSFRTHINSWHASLVPPVLNQCLSRSCIRDHTFITKYRCFSFQFKACNDLHAALQLVMRNSALSRAMNCQHFHCSNVPLFHCSFLQLLHCSFVSLFHCSNVPLFYCSFVLLFPFLFVPLFHCTNVILLHFSFVPLSHCYSS